MLPVKIITFGQKESAAHRTITFQKCTRSNDIENTGWTTGHHTVFEMLGNLSFGDYFKEQAITYPEQRQAKGKVSILIS